MRLLLLSDIHANLEALEACLDVAPPHDRVMNLGDVVGYNASPNEVCERVRAMGSPLVRGNHDRACSGLTDLKEFNLVAALSARWTQETLLPQHLEWLRALPQGPVRGDDSPDAEFVHGSPRDEDEYVLNPTTASFNFRLPGHADRIFFGHTHIQGGFTYRNGKTQPFAPQYDTGEDVVQFSMTLAAGGAVSHQPRLGGTATRWRLARRLCALRDWRRCARQGDFLPRALRCGADPAADSGGQSSRAAGPPAEAGTLAHFRSAVIVPQYW